MENNPDKKNQFSRANPGHEMVFYEIIIQGQLEPQRSNWFEGMALSYSKPDEDGLPCTLISGPVIDQPALHGLLTKIRDLNLTLISVRRYIPGTSNLEEISAKPELSGDRESFA